MPTYLNVSKVPGNENLNQSDPDAELYVEVDEDSTILADAPVGSYFQSDTIEEAINKFNGKNRFFVKAFVPDRDTDEERPYLAALVAAQRRHNSNSGLVVFKEVKSKAIYINELDSKGTNTLIQEARKYCEEHHVNSVHLNLPWLRPYYREWDPLNSNHLVKDSNIDRKTYEEQKVAWTMAVTRNSANRILLPYNVKATLTRTGILHLDEESYKEVNSKIKAKEARDQLHDKALGILRNRFDWSRHNKHDRTFERILYVGAFELYNQMAKSTRLLPLRENKGKGKEQLESFMRTIFTEFMDQVKLKDNNVGLMFKKLVPRNSQHVKDAVNAMRTELIQLYRDYKELAKINDAKVLFGRKSTRQYFRGLYAYPYSHKAKDNDEYWQIVYMRHYIEAKYPGWEIYEHYREYCLSAQNASPSMTWLHDMIAKLKPITKLNPV